MRVTKKFKHIFLGASIISIYGCATGPGPGRILSRVSDTEVQAALGKVNVGDHVELLENQCWRGPVNGSDAIEEQCEFVPIAHGEVVQVLSADYSRVRFPPGTRLSEDRRVAKHKH